MNTDGSSALQPTSTNEYITRADLIEIVSETVHRELGPMRQDIENLRLAINGAAKKEEVITPAQVDTKIEESERKIVRLFDDKLNGFIDTVRQYGERTEGVQRESKEQVKQVTELVERNNKETNDKILRLTEQMLEISKTAHESNADTRKHVDGEMRDVRKNVQDIENQTNTNRSMISDIDARGQQMTAAIPEIKDRLSKLETFGVRAIIALATMMAGIEGISQILGG